MDSVGNIIMYFIIAAAIIIFSILTVTTRKVLRSATYLLFVLLATAGIYFQLDYEFLGAVQIAVYAGGIMVLIVFAILLTNRPGEKIEKISNVKRTCALLTSVLGVGVCTYALVSQAEMVCKNLSDEFSLNIDQIGTALLSTDKFGYLLPFEAISVLLLACIIGGVVIARKR